MNANTLISVHCYAGDADNVRMLLPYYEHHNAPIVVCSPVDSPVTGMGLHICRHAGLRAYIGRESLDRQVAHMKLLLSYDFQFYLLNDADSFCVSAEIPSQLYQQADNTLWSGEIGDFRPHESPYPKIACQPPYFLSRSSLERLVEAAPKLKFSPITPYIDFAMMGWSCEAGLLHRSFSALEHTSYEPFTGGTPWEYLAFRIRYMGATMVHPIKAAEHRDLCVSARKFYESQTK